MKIAILGGTGEQGPGLALRWAKAEEEVIIGSRQKEKGERVAAELNQILGRELIRGTDNLQAARETEIVALTIPFIGHRALLESVKDALQGKMLVDVSVPLDPDNPRRVKMPPAGSAAEEAQEILGPGVKVVAAFQNISAHLLRDLSAAIDSDVLICGDDAGAKKEVIRLARCLGIRGLDAGPLRNARMVEPLTALLIHLNIRYRVRSSGLRITGIV